MTKLDFTPDPRCALICKDDAAWLVASYWSVEHDGNSFGEIVAEYAVQTVAAPALGRDVRKALKKYSVIDEGEELPADPIDTISGGKPSKFTKGSITVSVCWQKEEKSLLIQGGSAPTSAGAIYQLPLDPLDEKVSDEKLGEVVIRLVKSIKKKDAL
jgi:hypothetical protein